MKRIVLLNGSKKMVRHAKSLGLEVILLYEPGDKGETGSEQADQIYPLHFEDHEQLLQLAGDIYHKKPFDSVLSLTEKGLLPAATLTNAFHLPGNSLETVALLKDKWLMRQRLNSAGFSPVAAMPGTTKEDIESFIAQHDLPVLLKPIDGVGSYGICILNSPQDIANVWQKLQLNHRHSFLLEEFLDGPEVSVEAFSFHGQHVILAVTDKRTNEQCIEIGHVIPSQLPPSALRDIKQLVLNFLQIVGLREGPSHTEVKFTANGPRIIESHNRVGGDKINKLVSLVYGIDMIALTIAWSSGYAERLQAAPEPQQGAAVCFFSAQPGLVKQISGFAEIQRHPQVVEAALFVGVNSSIPPLRHSSDRPGYVVTRGETASAALALSKDLVQRLCIDTDGCLYEAKASHQTV